MARILLNRYHNVVDDIAVSLTKLGHKVSVCIDTGVSDHYGSHLDLYNKIKDKYKDQHDVLTLNNAVALLKQKRFDLLGLDGVYSGDQILKTIAKNSGVPYFCIDGYPYLFDEDSDNILSLGWSLPTIQYLQKNPSEGHVKELDWQNIFKNGRSDFKNILSFYPSFWDLKSKTIKSEFKEDKFVSGIHRYQECNKWNYEVFKKVSESVNVENFESKGHSEFIDSLSRSKGLLMLKWADRPGIALLEALLLSKPVFTMKSYVLASMNQEVLIDNFNAIIADTTDELIHRMKNITSSELHRLGTNAYLHAEMLTRFERQKLKLETFIENCLR